MIEIPQLDINFQYSENPDNNEQIKKKINLIQIEDRYNNLNKTEIPQLDINLNNEQIKK